MISRTDLPDNYLMILDHIASLVDPAVPRFSSGLDPAALQALMEAGYLAGDDIAIPGDETTFYTYRLSFEGLLAVLRYRERLEKKRLADLEKKSNRRFSWFQMAVDSLVAFGLSLLTFYITSRPAP